MAGRKSTVELPEGWIEEAKTSNRRKTKTFTNVETGQKFYSKAEVMRYVNRESISQVTPQKLSPKSTPQQPVKQSTPQKPSPKSTPPQPVKQSTPPQPVKQSTPPQSSRRKRLATEDEPEKETEPVITNETPDWLPSGWTMEVKPSKGSARDCKIYIEPSTGRKFYSKPQVLQHTKIPEQVDTTSKRTRSSRHGPEDSSLGKPKNPENGSPSKLKKVHDNSITKGKETVDDSPAELKERTDATLGDENPNFDWLPSDWKMVIKTKSSGQKYKCYIDPKTGSKFYSRPEVIKHLNVENSGGISLSKKIEVAASHGKSKKKVVIERGTPDKLPSGWIKEIKIERKGLGIRRDPFYTDPVSRYVFRSQNDALRYIETGDINSCAIKPKLRDELDWLSGDISPSPAAAAAVDGRKSQAQTTKRSRFEGKQTDTNSGTLETKSDNGGSTKRQRLSRSSSNKTNETLDDNTFKEEQQQPITPSPPKSQSRRKATSSRKAAYKTENSPADGNRTSGRKKAVTTTPKEPSVPSRSSRRISTQLKAEEEKVDQPEEVLPVQAEPISSFTVKPTLAETLNDALGIDVTNMSEGEGVEEEFSLTGVGNSPRKEETTKDELFQFGGSSWRDIDIIKEPEPESEPELELEPNWLDRPLDFVLNNLVNENSTATAPPTAPAPVPAPAPAAPPVVQDYFREHKKVDDDNQHNHDLGAPGFTNFNFLNQGNNIPASPASSQFTFLQSSNVSPSVNQSLSPANPLFHSGIMPSPANPLFPPNNNNDDNNQSPSMPANLIFPPGGFGFQ
ncbi:serine/arginine repetitive matrix protein 2-like [Impatiens glandulifera]|uniref:serine/arginine repetitive matrix protein 2-like n=1 Tax=Impatiens glandulifera TaxID=253017 RepID=UPI001FB13555|nr:serine/arginine repetitive matrix protein 2-like [Impatiens glandulifera]